MKFTVLYTSTAIKNLKKLDPSTKKTIKGWIEKNLLGCEDPRAHGKALQGNLRGLWRYRIGDYRLIVEIRDQELLIIALAIGHRFGV